MCRSREVCECVSRVRLVSWLVLGALCNSQGGQGLAPHSPHSPHSPPPQPVPQDATCHITDYIQVTRPTSTSVPPPLFTKKMIVTQVFFLRR